MLLRNSRYLTLSRKLIGKLSSKAHQHARGHPTASSGVTGTNLPVDADFIAGSTRDAFGGLQEARGA
jgi:hypothetical protein